jgi:hypothetical protein
MQRTSADKAQTFWGWQSLLLAAIAAVILAGAVGSARAANDKEKEKDKDDEKVRRSTAVTLNYCRASFYRIQRSPTYRVLIEEQEKILNNLDLNGIVDQDVVKLYTAVLVEISEVRLSDRAHQVVQEKYHTALGTVLTGDAFDFGTELASAHYLSAIRTGARSWWDYRNVATARDSDVFQVDQKRLMAFTEKSAQFLDTFWKLARDRKIPDRWLVRNQDLSKLDAAMQEHDLSVRLRVLKRMEDFMACYPPYWYYVGRTQQCLGQLSAAAETYEKLLRLGQGHFRKDDMLAAGLANRAVIQDFLHQPCAAETAIRALDFSTDVWEANLMCAHVLGRNGRLIEAEDAVLRNLDVGLEREQSAVALVSLYTLNGNRAKLQAQLSNPAIVRRVPMPALIRAAVLLGPRRLPEAVIVFWATSMSARYEINFGPDDFVLDTTPLWHLQASEMSLVVGDEAFRQSTIALLSGRSEVRFAKVAEIGHPLYAASNSPPVVLIVKYPGTPIVRVRLDYRAETARLAASFPVVDLLTSGSFSGRRQNLSLASVEIGETEFPVAARLAAGTPAELVESDVTTPNAHASKVEQPKVDKPVTVLPSTVSQPAQQAGAKTKDVPSEKSPSAVPEPPLPLLSVPKLPTHSSLPADGPKLFP